jgi:hypothetical protein
VRAPATLRWLGLALLGILVAAGVAIAASRLASQQIGLASEPISAGDALAPTLRPHGRRPGRRRPHHHVPATTPTVTTPPATTTAPPPPTPTTIETAAPEPQPEGPSHAGGGEHGGEHRGGHGGGHGGRHADD